MIPLVYRHLQLCSQQIWRYHSSKETSTNNSTSERMHEFKIPKTKWVGRGTRIDIRTSTNNITMWVHNANNDKEIILSTSGWLNDSIISAAQNLMSLSCQDCNHLQFSMLGVMMCIEILYRFLAVNQRKD